MWNKHSRWCCYYLAVLCWHHDLSALNRQRSRAYDLIYSRQIYCVERISFSFFNESVVMASSFSDVSPLLLRLRNALEWLMPKWFKIDSINDFPLISREKFFSFLRLYSSTDTPTLNFLLWQSIIASAGIYTYVRYPRIIPFRKSECSPEFLSSFFSVGWWLPFIPWTTWVR